ncbi:hypothetical protein [Serratia marcescens]|uniref:hypothetical protein n=1 Tax=Serratia marcescens TaxID=615 RepID=UPI0027E3E2BF|nr:hypothetical protein [Serratia marcescens]
MKKLLLLCLPVIYSCNVYSSEKACSENLSSVNTFNNMILAQDSSTKKIPKKVSMRIESKDDYIKADTQMEFDECGALLSSRSNKTIRSRINNNILLTQLNGAIDKNHKNWDYNMTFKMSMIEHGDAQSELLTQKMSGSFLTDSNGKIIRSEDTSDISVGKNQQSGKAITTFSTDEAGSLSGSNRVSTLGNDSGNTVYSYDAKNRLIRTLSGTTTGDFTYDNDDRELTSKEVMKSFATETTTTTCKSWDKFGRCIHAQQNISILIKDVKKNRDNVYNHVAEIKYDYVY